MQVLCVPPKHCMYSLHSYVFVVLLIVEHCHLCMSVLYECYALICSHQKNQSYISSQGGLVVFLLVCIQWIKVKFVLCKMCCSK